MTTKDLPQNDLIHEVEEALHQERLQTLWKEYGPYLIAGCVLAVLFTALVTGYRTWDKNINEAQTAQIIEATQSDDIPAALTQIAGRLRPGQKAIAEITAAGLLLQEGDNEAALVQYQTAAADKTLEAQWRDMATLMAVKIEWDMTDAESRDTASFLGRLNELIANDQSPWQNHARLQAALIAAHGQNDYEQARALLAPVLESKTAPQSLRSRAKALDHIYALKAAQNTKEASDK